MGMLIKPIESQFGDALWRFLRKNIQKQRQKLSEAGGLGSYSKENSKKSKEN